MVANAHQPQGSEEMKTFKDGYLAAVSGRVGHSCSEIPFKTLCCDVL